MLKNIRHIGILLKPITAAVLLLAGFTHYSISGDNDRISIQGTVTDQATNEPIENVNIMIQGTNIGTTTASDGKYTLDNVPPGLQTVRYTHINYVSYTQTDVFTAGITETIDVTMESRPIVLEEVEVVDTIPRRHILGRALGYSFDMEDIERTGAVTFAQLIQSLVPQARVRESGGNVFIQLRQRETIAQRYGRAFEPYPLIVIDGMQIGTSPIGLSGIVNPGDIDRLDVIRPPESQTVFGNQAQYGVIIIETKDRSGEEQLLTGTQRLLIASGLGVLMFLMYLIF